VAVEVAAMRWFKSKIDTWLIVLLFLPLLIAIGAVIWTVLYKGEEAWIACGALAVVLLFLFGLVLPVRYGIGGGELVIRHGLVRQRCKLEQILSVMPTRSPLSSPALSLDRLEVRTGERWSQRILISPAEREAFLALLASAAGLQRDGAGWRRA
jgi:hypothetical protein